MEDPGVLALRSLGPDVSVLVFWSRSFYAAGTGGEVFGALSASGIPGPAVGCSLDSHSNPVSIEFYPFHSVRSE